jgi:hypothetical protein
MLSARMMAFSASLSQRLKPPHMAATLLGLGE